MRIGALDRKLLRDAWHIRAQIIACALVVAAVGKVTGQIFHDNQKAWSGDHCIDRSLVPGVLFCNRTITDEHPRLVYIGPTVVHMFGVTVPAHMDGRPLNVSAKNQ